MSVPPSDPGQLNTGGFQPLLPPDGGTAQPDAPKRGHKARTVLIVCLATAMVVALIVVLANRSSFFPVPATASPIPGAGMPIDVAPATVVEAIDLDSQPGLGAAWDASDGDLGELNSQLFVTPCGVLVTALVSNFDHTGGGANARLVGYEISTGTKVWTVPLQRATGLNDPNLNSYHPTYTSDCSMVLTLRDMDQTVTTMVALMVDLSTGEATPFASSEDLRTCAATSPGRAACWGNGSLTTYDVARGTQQSMTSNALAEGYTAWGDVVVDGLVWSQDGYLDPATSDVVFGADVYVPEWGEDKDWVVYVEPQRPGGYHSGIAVRVQGPLRSANGTCSFMIWDIQSDTGSWAQPASIPCGLDSYFDWAVTESALIVSDMLNDSVWAFSLVDGTMAWEMGNVLCPTAWNRNDIETMPGLTEDFVVVYDREHNKDIVRIADGETVPAPSLGSWNFMTLSPTLLYATGYTPNGRKLAGFLLDGSETPLWTVDLPSDSYNFWTFATGGTMYIVSSDNGSPTTVIPLIG